VTEIADGNRWVIMTCNDRGIGVSRHAAVIAGDGGGLTRRQVMRRGGAAAALLGLALLPGSALAEGAQVGTDEWATLGAVVSALALVGVNNLESGDRSAVIEALTRRADRDVNFAKTVKAVTKGVKALADGSTSFYSLPPATALEVLQTALYGRTEVMVPASDFVSTKQRADCRAAGAVATVPSGKVADFFADQEREWRFDFDPRRDGPTDEQLRRQTHAGGGLALIDLGVSDPVDQPLVAAG
jgi:hypothetical protein